MSVTSLTGTTWVLNTSLTYSPFTYDGLNGKETYIYADAVSSDIQITRIRVRDNTNNNTFYVNYNDNTTSVYQNGWVSEDYRTITFLGEPYYNGSVFHTATVAEAISWLEANAVQILPDVSVSLGTSSIASLNDTGSVTLATQNTYLTDDITVEYTKPSSPTPTLQSKSVSYTPTTSQQTASVTADAGYDGLSAVNVTVNAMPSGTAGTPTAIKGTASNHSVAVTPSVTNTTGYITGGTKTGTAVTVTAEELASGTKIITSNGEGIDVVGYLDVDVSVTPTLQSKSVTYSPSITQQTDTVTADSGYDGLSSVNVTVNAVSRGTAGTPTATKGTVSNNSVSVTPTVTNVGGMISGGTKTGTAVTVSASELVSGTLSITSNGTYNVANFSSAEVNVSGGGDDSLSDFIMNHGTITSLELPSITSIGQGAFAYCTSLTTVSFPLCEKIGSYAFYNCSSLTTASFSLCTSIGSFAFNICSKLSTISFPVCQLIGSYAFYSCSSLTTASFPSCTSIGSSAFCYCFKLSTISFPVCQSIGANAFYYCSSLTTADFPSCTLIGNNAFSNCRSLKTISFPLCKSIGLSAFANCSSLTTADFPSCTFIGNSAFSNCSRLTTISFPICNAVNGGAFYNCYSLTTAVFPSCLTIASSAFYNCSSLTTASFPSCISLSNSAFYKCYNLVSLYLLGSSVVKLQLSGAFSSTPIAGYTTSTGGVYGSIFVPSSLYSSYKTATNWTYFSSRFVSV